MTAPRAGIEPEPDVVLKPGAPIVQKIPPNRVSSKMPRAGELVRDYDEYTHKPTGSHAAKPGEQFFFKEKDGTTRSHTVRAEGGEETRQQRRARERESKKASDRAYGT